MARVAAIVGWLLVANVLAHAGPPRWQEVADAPSVKRIWGTGADLYGVGSSATYHSIDGGASWSVVRGVGGANGVWGTAPDDVWIVAGRTISHSLDGHGATWNTQRLDLLSFAAVMEGMWGAANDRYVFGGDRGSDGILHAAILHSRDGGASWRREELPVDVARISGMWGSAANEVYAVGARGVVLHSTGDGTWRVVRPPSGESATLEGIWGRTATEIYAVGAGGSILHSADRGKTWAARASGVRYALSSIFGGPGEIYVGSSDGPPLRSTDGRTWRPLTALVPRGHVWASDRDHVLVSAQTAMHYFGESEPIAAPPPPVLPVLTVAAMAPPTRIVPRPPAPTRCDPGIAARVSDEEGMADTHLRQGSFAVALLAYERVFGCKPTVLAKLYISACRARQFVKAAQYFTLLPSSRMESMAQICTREGFDPRKGLPVPAPTVPPTAAVPTRADRCVPRLVAALEARGDSKHREKAFAAALLTYEAVLDCKPSLVEKAYVSACRARLFAKAEPYFNQLPATKQDGLVQACIKEGFDPRRPASSKPTHASQLATVKAAAQRFGSRYPYARDVMLIAAARFGDPTPLAPRLAFAGSRPNARLGQISNCGPLDQSHNPPIAAFGLEIVVDLSCSCSANAVTARGAVTTWRDGMAVRSRSFSLRSSTGSCSPTAYLDLGKPDFELGYEKDQLEEFLEDAGATTGDAQTEVYARYLLEGGQDNFRPRLAALLQQPVSWPGFFWNARP